MKKFVSMLLLGAICISLAACGGGQTNTPAAPAAPAASAAVSAQPASSTPVDTTGLPPKPADFPTSTITCIVGYAAGGGVDTAARLLLKYAQKYIDVPLIVTNVTGASGAVAVSQALGNAADGTTLISVATGAMLADITNAVEYDYLNDLQMVSVQDLVPYALSFRTGDSRFSTGEEFIQYVKDHPGELTVSTSGINNANYFSTKSFFEDNGMSVEIISFDGSADAKTAFLGEHVDAYCETLLETKNMTDAGQAICVCTFGDQEYLEGVPSNEDLGYAMSVTGTYRGYAVKAGTSPEIVDYLAAIFEKCEQDPEFIAECETIGLGKCINYMNPSQAAAFMQEQFDSYTVFCEAQGLIG